ncbi:hypothetical protein GTP55_12275 [Duganella sp. FT109W]|uniref:DUF3304 domain-containing protein n=1 Tax=Duganella margarita TaxID=2692170 RepID=A0ABW9WIC8_9BURK|nr:hypothetical protein [Duganella margarita]MYN40150.1 hypothetical protein [Duganella margarita]
MRLTSLLALSLAVPVTGQAAAPDLFEGIYSTVDPRTGAQTDMFKIWKGVDDYTVLSNYNSAWSGPQSGHVGTPPANEVLPGPFPQDPRVRTLWIEKMGAIYQMPPGALSVAGRSDTGYLAHMVQLGSPQLLRRPLLTGRAERGERGESKYKPGASEQRVTITTLNFSSKAVQVGVSDPRNKDNAVDTDPLAPYMASLQSCCYYLPQKWHAALRLNVEVRSPPEGQTRTITLPVPKYDKPDNLAVAVRADGKIELVERPASDDMAAMPAPPAAELVRIRAAIIQRQKANVADLTRQMEKEPGAAREFRDDLTALQQTLRYTEALAACHKTPEECEREAIAQAKAVR